MGGSYVGYDAWRRRDGFRGALVISCAAATAVVVGALGDRGLGRGDGVVSHFFFFSLPVGGFVKGQGL